MSQRMEGTPLQRAPLSLTGPDVRGWCLTDFGLPQPLPVQFPSIHVFLISVKATHMDTFSGQSFEVNSGSLSFRALFQMAL